MKWPARNATLWVTGGLGCAAGWSSRFGRESRSNKRAQLTEDCTAYVIAASCGAEKAVSPGSTANRSRTHCFREERHATSRTSPRTPQPSQRAPQLAKARPLPRHARICESVSNCVGLPLPPGPQQGRGPEVATAHSNTLPSLICHRAGCRQAGTGAANLTDRAGMHAAHKHRHQRHQCTRQLTR